jgi:hypothetical protein
MRIRACLLAGAAVIAAPAHDYPVTYGVLTLAKGKASLRLRLVLHHLQPELEAFAGRGLSLKDGEIFEAALLEAYLKDRLVLRDGAGRVLPWKVASQDADAFDLVLTLEAPLPSAKGARLRHTLFFDRHRAQQNLVTVEGLGARRGLTFDAKHPELPLEGARR